MFLSAIVLALSVSICQHGASGQDADAVRLCGDIHRVDIHTVANIDARFVNSRCGLQCHLDGAWLPIDYINDGYSCAESQICHEGLCVASANEALQECSTRHGLNFMTINATGTGLRNDGCSLECAIQGKRMSMNVRRQGLPCGEDAVGFCKDGICFVHDQPTTHVTESSKPTTTTTINTSPSANVPDRAFLDDPHNLRSMRIIIDHAELQASYQGIYVVVCLVPSDSASSLCRQNSLCRTADTTAAVPMPSWQHTCEPIFIDHEHLDDRLLVGIWQRSMSSVGSSDLIGTDSFPFNFVLSDARYNPTSRLGQDDSFYAIRKNGIGVGSVELRIEFAYNN